MSTLNRLHLGASDRGFFEIDNDKDYTAYIAYGLYEGESAAYVTEDNPYGAYIDQENTLVLIRDAQLLIVELYNGLTIGENLTVSYGF